MFVREAARMFVRLECLCVFVHEYLCVLNVCA